MYNNCAKCPVSIAHLTEVIKFMNKSFGAATLLAAIVILLSVGTAAAQNKARKYDEFGTIKLADANARLDNLAIEMQNEFSSEAYIITYGGKTSAAGAAKKSAAKFKTYLSKTRGIDPARIVTVDGGYREGPTTELWIVPTGALPPRVSPTVDPSEVKPPKKKTRKQTK